MNEQIEQPDDKYLFDDSRFKGSWFSRLSPILTPEQHERISRRELLTKNAEEMTNVVAGAAGALMMFKLFDALVPPSLSTDTNMVIAEGTFATVLGMVAVLGKEVLLGESRVVNQFYKNAARIVDNVFHPQKTKQPSNELK